MTRRETPIQDLYFYNIDMTVPASSEKTDYLKISADADFIVKRISITADDYSTRILIKDTSSAKEWFNSPIRLDHLAGNYGANRRPNSLFTPKKINANNTITITLKNTTASVNNVCITFEGYREVVAR